MTPRRASRVWMPAGLALLLSSVVSFAQTRPSQPQPDAQAPPPPQTSIAEALSQAAQAVAKAEERGADASVQARRAHDLATRVLSLDPVNVQAKYILGRVLLLQGRAREAMGYLLDYVAQREGETDWFAYKLLGDIYLEGKYYKMAQGKYEQAVRLKPNEPDVYVGLAHAAMAQGRLDESAQHARKAIEVAPQPSAQPYQILARASMGKKPPDFVEAEAAARRAVDLIRDAVRADPSVVEKLSELDSAYALLLNILHAKRQAYPEQATLYLTIADVIQQRSDLSRLMACHRALAVLVEGIENTQPNTPAELLYEAARLQYEVGQADAAKRTLETLLEKEPGHSEGKALLEKLGSQAG